MPLFDDSTWRREEWYAHDEYDHPYNRYHDGLIGACIYLGRATGSLPMLWAWLFWVLVWYGFCLGFEIFVAVAAGHQMFSEPAVYLLPPVFGALMPLIYRRRALWRLRD